MQTGKIVQVMGPVVDVEFMEAPLPKIKTAMVVDNHGVTGTMEVRKPAVAACGPPRRDWKETWRSVPQEREFPFRWESRLSVVSLMYWEKPLTERIPLPMERNGKFIENRLLLWIKARCRRYWKPESRLLT